MSLVIDNSDTSVGNQHFSSWENFLKIIICLDIIRRVVPELSTVISSVEELSWDFFYKFNLKRLFLSKNCGDPYLLYISLKRFSF